MITQPDVSYQKQVDIVKKKLETATMLAYAITYTSDGEEVDVDTLYGKEAGDAIHSYALFDRWAYHHSIFNKTAPLQERLCYDLDREETNLDEDIKFFNILLSELNETSNSK